MKLSSRINRIEESPTMAIAERTAELINSGADIINLCVGEPDFPTPDNIKNAAFEAIKNNFTRYTANSGFTELRSAISNKYKRDYNLDISLNQTIVSNGAKQSVFNSVQVVVEEGDEVIIPAPYYVSYTHMVKIAGGVPIIAGTNADNGFKLTPEKLEEKITEKTKAFIICNPCNPTGTVYTKNELAALAEVIKKHNLFVISDEVYEKLIFDNIDYTSFASVLNDKVIVISGMSKTYAMTGWRIGYAVADEKIISAMNKYQSHSTSGANSIAQFAAVEALNGNQKGVEDMRKEFELRRNYLHSEISGIKGINCYKSAGAFYLFPDISSYFGRELNGFKINSSYDFALFLLEKAKVALVPGTGFGADGFVRIVYASSMETLKEAVGRIKNLICE